MYSDVIEKIKLEISKSTKIAILGHINADGDAVGACVALNLLLPGTQVLFEEKIPEMFCDILDIDYEVYDGSQSGYDLVISLDCADKERLGKRSVILDNADFVINIDHHVTNTKFGDINVVEPEAAATCELLYEMISSCDINIPLSVATALFMGMSTDTGHFRFSNTSPDTMKFAGELINKGIDIRKMTKLLYETVSYNTLMFTSYATHKIELFYEGKIATLTVTDEMLEKYGVSYQDADSLSQVPRSIAGVDVGVVIKQKDDAVKVSMRADGAVDLSAFAFKFGGGGHVNAAGISFENKTVEEVKETIVKALISEMK